MQLLNAFKCNLKELTTKSAWVPRSAVFGMRMPGGWLHRSYDSLARSFFPSCWVLSVIFFVFPRCFSSLRAFRHRCRRFRELFFVFSVCFFEGLVHIPRNTVNSISALLDPSGSASSPSDESAPSTTSNSTSSSSFTSSPSSVSISAETLTQAISQAFQQSLPQMLAAFRENGAPNSTSGTSGNSSAASFATSVPSTYTSTSTACRSSSLAGIVTVLSFLSTYSSVGIPVVPRASQPPVPALSAPSLLDYSLVPSTSSPTLAPSVGKTFVVGPGYAPVPGKLVAKITSGAFVELADLLAKNISAQEAAPHTYLDGKLLVAPAKKRVVEIIDILTWIQAFTIYPWIFCSTCLSRWQDTTQYKLLILQTASQFPGPAWLNYDTAFRKDAAASLLADWSKMNLDLYNFHTRASGTVTGQSAPHSPSLPHTSASSNVPPKRSFDPIQYCRSWNDGACRWCLGQCRYRHVSERCNGQHPLTNCLFRAYKGSQRSRSLTPSGGKRRRR